MTAYLCKLFLYLCGEKNMLSKEIVHRTLDIVSLILNPNPISGIRFMADSIYSVLDLIEGDPFSDIAYKIAKSEITAALNIMSKIELEGDKNGALQRVLTHLESAFGLTKIYYREKILVSIKNFVGLISKSSPWIFSEESITINSDIIKMAFHITICHYLIGSSEELTIAMLVDDVPYYLNYEFLDYSKAFEKLLSNDVYNTIIEKRKYKFQNYVQFLAAAHNDFHNHHAPEGIIKSIPFDRARIIVEAKLRTLLRLNKFDSHDVTRIIQSTNSTLYYGKLKEFK